MERPSLKNLAVLVVVCIVVAVYFAATRREPFEVSPAARALHGRTRALFARRGGAATFTEFREKYPQGDAVQFSDLRALYLGGSLTPRNVQTVM